MIVGEFLSRSVFSMRPNPHASTCPRAVDGLEGALTVPTLIEPKLSPVLPWSRLEAAVVRPVNLTSLVCIRHQADELKVRLGDWDVHRDDEFYPYVESSVVAAAVHPDFYPGNLHNDLALLKLERPLDLAAHPHIAPACLPEQGEKFDNRRCWVTGWGKNAFGEQGEYQSVLKEVDVPVLSHGDCQRRMRNTRLGRSYALHPGFVCAGGEPGKDACTGDGGSPLVCEGGAGWKVAGLVSWGIGCGQPGVPGVYVNVANYRAWIDAIIHGRQHG
ncbi:hypothetical protein JTE90_003713 [Oedothorax gibbosus]|uniref:Peptidase S1 domain-containing protein n=1 Tax=Oedothorax gibbosus TaxID=931172 RepID=A0AAV6VC81_9ARAC|nr:hypothetical protein JTE90_003713 [Oedothorax gibbosus]